jgi:hypothetical protein
VGEEYGDRLSVVLVRGVRGFVGKYERCRGFRGERVNGGRGAIVLWELAGSAFLLEGVGVAYISSELLLEETSGSSQIRSAQVLRFTFARSTNFSSIKSFAL